MQCKVPIKPRDILTAAVLSMLFLAILPTPAAAFHGREIASPREGMEIRIEPNADYDLRLTFGSATERLVGHHEWRDVVHVDEVYTYDNVSYGLFGRVLDLETGMHLGTSHGASFEHVHTAGLLRQGYSGESGYLEGSTLWFLLPESALWGREIDIGQSWEIPHTSPFCPEMRTWVEVDGDWEYTDERPWGEPANLTATIRRECVRDDGEWTQKWTLAFGEGRGPFATERLYEFTSQTSYGNASGSWEQKLTVLDDGTDALDFRGHSHAPVHAARDQTLTYTSWSELFPADPEPHALFDIAQAGRQALDASDEEVRVFLSQAESFALGAARMVRDDPRVEWDLTFADSDGTELRVRLEGLKIPDGRLLVTERSAESHERTRPSGSSPADRPVASPGDLARLTDQAFAARDLEPTGYAWGRDRGGVVYCAESEAQGLPQLDSLAREVCSDASTGVVVETDHRDRTNRPAFLP